MDGGCCQRVDIKKGRTMARKEEAVLEDLRSLLDQYTDEQMPFRLRDYVQTREREVAAEKIAKGTRERLRIFARTPTPTKGKFGECYVLGERVGEFFGLHPPLPYRNEQEVDAEGNVLGVAEKKKARMVTHLPSGMAVGKAKDRKTARVKIQAYLDTDGVDWSQEDPVEDLSDEIKQRLRRIDQAETLEALHHATVVE